MTGFRILIRAFTARRDVMHSMILARLLENDGNEVIVSSIRQFEFAVKFWKPHAIIFNIQGLSEYLKRISPDSVRILVPGEGGEFGKFSLAQVWKRLSKKHVTSTDLTFFWNKKSLEESLKVFPFIKKDSTCLVGNPKFDVIRSSKKIVTNTNKIGFPTRFNAINYHDGQNYCFVSLMPQRYKLTHTLTYSAMYAFHSMMKIIEQILENTELKISIRPHPLESVDSYYEYVLPEFEKDFKDRVEIDSSLCIVEWLNQVDAIVTPTTTSIYEAYLLNKVIISIDKIAKISKFNNTYNELASTLEKSCIMPSSTKELISLVKNIKKIKRKKCKKLEKYLSDYHMAFGKKSTNLTISKKIQDFLKKQKLKKKLHLPKALVSLGDKYLFYREMKKNKYHWNCNYHYGFHEKPKLLDEIVKNIEQNNNKKV